MMKRLIEEKELIKLLFDKYELSLLKEAHADKNIDYDRIPKGYSESYDEYDPKNNGELDKYPLHYKEDTNENWHKYPEERPKEDDDYIVYLEDPNFCPSIDIYDYSVEKSEFGYITIDGLGPVKWKSIDSCVKAWMKKPEPLKFS